MVLNDELLPLLACPRCGKQPLAQKDTGLYCPGCKTEFPTIGGIPWVFADPATTLNEWRNRWDRALKDYGAQIQSLAQELESKDLRDKTRLRLQRRHGALQDQTHKMAELMKPLGISDRLTDMSTYLALRTRLPQDHGLNTYYSNVHRDWVWGDPENLASIEILKALDLEHTGNLAVLGCGAGRLAYDLHNELKPDATIAMDFNPFLLFVCQAMARGEQLELYEFPLAPRTTSDLAVLQTLKAPNGPVKDFYCLGANVLRSPLALNSLDTLITPWLIDVVDEPVEIFAQRINQWLKPGGMWVNFGSLTFSHPSQAHRPNIEELQDLLAESGFTQLAFSETVIPYMHSPHSRHARQEEVVAFVVKKESSAPAPKRHVALPDWLVKGDTPVPLLPEFHTQSMTTRVFAFLMAMIDGKRTIKDMAKMMVEQRLLEPQDAEATVRNFMIKMFDESQYKQF